MKIKSLVFGDFLDFSDKNSSNIVNNQLTRLVHLCKVFETSSQISRCLMVLPYQWAVRNKQNKFCGSLVFPYCTISYHETAIWKIDFFEKNSFCQSRTKVSEFPPNKNFLAITSISKELLFIFDRLKRPISPK